METASAKTYWQIPSDSAIYPEPFKSRGVVGVLWSTKVDHTTFFGNNTEYIFGIQMLPFTPRAKKVLEIAAQAREMAAPLDAVIAPCSGGGLISGCALALAQETPETEIHAAEPADFDDTARSLARGERLHVDPDARSICDALLTPMPGELTFAINRRLLTGGLTADDGAVLRAMKAAFRYFKLVVEPGGAVALAAVLTGAYDCRGKTVAVVCSGGNVDADVFRRALDMEA